MAEIEWEASSRLIVVTGSPDQSDSFEVIAKNLGHEIMERQMSGITDVYDGSTEDAAVLTIRLARDANAQPILDWIGRHLDTDENRA